MREERYIEIAADRWNHTSNPNFLYLDKEDRLFLFFYTKNGKKTLVQEESDSKTLHLLLKEIKQTNGQIHVNQVRPRLRSFRYSFRFVRRFQTTKRDFLEKFYTKVT